MRVALLCSAPLLLATTLASAAPALAQVAAGALAAEGEPRGCEPALGGPTAPDWGVIREALRSAAAAQERGAYRYRAVVYERRLDPDAREILEEAAQVALLDQSMTFLRPDEPALARYGFVQDSAGEVFFQTPHPATFLSAAFHADHCFRGLAFEPDGRRSVAGITGSFELDGEGSLRAVEYRYTGLPWDIPEVLGGRLELHRLGSGDWVITRSWLRTPFLEVHVAADTDEPGAFPGEVLLSGVRESGTAVVEVLDSAGGATGFVRPGSLVGVVYDSLAGAPLSGADVLLLTTDYRVTDHRARTDDGGEYRFPALPPGEYRVAFEHPRREAVGYRPQPPAVTVPAGLVERLDLAIPVEIPPPWSGPVAVPGAPGAVEGGVAGGLEVRTGRELPPGEGAWLTARILDAESYAPIEGMEVRLQGRRAVTDSAGWFTLRRLRPGEHVVEFDHIGYGVGHAPITMPERRETVATFRMPARALDLGEITVLERSREAERRRMSPVGVKIVAGAKLEEAAARGARIDDVVRNMGGLSVIYGVFYGPGHENRKAYIACIQPSRPFPSLNVGRPGGAQWCEMVEVYIDDISIPAAGELLANIPLTDFERVEYIPPLSATRWGLRASETGVLLLYTKR